MENFKSFSEAIQPGSVPEPGREAVGGRFKSAAPKKETKPAPLVTSEDTGVKSFSDFLEGRCWPDYKPKPGKKPYSPGSCVKESAAAAIAAATAISKKKSGNYDKEGFRKTPYKNPDHPNRKSNDERRAELKEDLRKWFSKTAPEGGWKRINSKGEAIGPCAREPGEPKPKCMSNEKRASLTKKERASAVAAKRKHDPNPERKGAPINVSNFGKGKISEDMENLEEKNVPTSPEKWAQAKAQAKSKFDVYPSAYANGWASKKYKEMGGGWKSVAEESENLEEGRPSQRHPLEGHEYHKKSDEALIHIAKDAHAAAEAMKSHNTTAENKYRDQANDSATVRHFRKTSGMPDWYKKKYGHMKEEIVNEVMDEPNYKNSIQARQAAADKSSTALSGLVAKKNLKQAEGKNKSQAFIDKMTSKVNAAKRLKEEDAYDKDAKPSDKPHDKEAAAKRAKIAAVMARRKMAKEEVEQIDEISTKTLAKAASAASDPDADYHYGKSHDPQKFADHAKKTKDAKSAAAVQGAADAKGHYTRPGHSLGSYDKLAHRTPARVTGAGKANKQDVNKLKKSISLNAEEVEQIDELSNDMLGRYKTAAGADASKADKAGDYNKGNKRFSGIVRATKKQLANDIVTRASSVTEAKEKTEYDYEGDMARGQLQSVINNAQRVHDMLEDNDNLPEWVQSKITLAEDYISTVANYMMSEIDEEVKDEYARKVDRYLKKKYNKEEVEQIDEREDDEYHAMGNHKVGVVISKDNGPKERMKATIRAKEPQHAVDKALKHYKDKGYTVHEHKYLGEGIADDKYGSAASETLVTKPYKEPAKKMKESKDDSPPFDGPYVKRTGTVTDKSGAKHTDMSRVRDLARTAMKKQASSYKAPKKLGEEASRKAEIVKTAAKKKKPDSKEDTFQAEPELSSTITKNY